MGIKNFFKIRHNSKIVEDYGEIVNYEDLYGTSVAIDALNIIYKNMGINRGNLLSHDGKRTHHIYIAITQIIKFVTSGICMHWIFDSGEVHELKAHTVEKRKQQREKYGISLSKEEIEDIKTLLTHCGITYSVVATEAEFYGSELSKLGGVAGVVTADTDVIVHGGVMLRPVTIEGIARFIRYSGKDLCGILGITKEKMYKIAAVLGCDFCKDKTPRIGPAKVLTHLDTIVLTESQQKACDYYAAPITKELLLHRSTATTSNVDHLTKWLESKGFGEKIINKLVDCLEGN